MQELSVRIRADSPVGDFTGAHPSTRVTIFMEELGGRTYQQLVVRGSRALQREYLRVAESWGCTPPVLLHETPEYALLQGGPCACGGTRPLCRSLVQTQDLVRVEFGTGVNAVEFVFERGRCHARLRQYEAAATPPATPGRVLVESVRRVSRTDQSDFLSSRLDASHAVTLRTALRMGYYAKPRQCTMEDLARELGITKSAVCHRLNKVEEKAIRALLQAHASWSDTPEPERVLPALATPP